MNTLQQREDAAWRAWGQGMRNIFTASPRVLRSWPLRIIFLLTHGFGWLIGFAFVVAELLIMFCQENPYPWWQTPFQHLWLLVTFRFSEFNQTLPLVTFLGIPFFVINVFINIVKLGVSASCYPNWRNPNLDHEYWEGKYDKSQIGANPHGYN